MLSSYNGESISVCNTRFKCQNEVQVSFTPQNSTLNKIPEKEVQDKQTEGKLGCSAYHRPKAIFH